MNRLMPTSSPSVHAAVPGQPMRMIAARTILTMPLNSIQVHALPTGTAVPKRRHDLHDPLGDEEASEKQRQRHDAGSGPPDQQDAHDERQYRRDQGPQEAGDVLPREHGDNSDYPADDKQPPGVDVHGQRCDDRGGDGKQAENRHHQALDQEQDPMSEEARKGMQEKAEQGIWPTKCPLGYRNVSGPDGKKIIATDRAIAPLIAKLFEWYSGGDISLKGAARKARAAGLVYPRSGAKVPVSTIHTILRNRLYTGWFEWNGKLIQGRHEALVSVDLWERVQGVLDGRFAKKAKRGKHDFAFSSLIACAQCGCAVVGEIKKQRYLYYHCTGYADKCQRDPASCRRKYMREEALEAQFTECLAA